MTVLVELFFTYALSTLLLVYIGYLVYYSLGLSRLRSEQSESVETVTVIVPARNEEQNIRRCIEALVHQNYPAEQYSVVVVNDHSTDATESIVKEFAGSNFPQVTLLNVIARSEGKSPKINALQHGMKQATGNIIMTTDADCVVSPGWIRSTVNYFEKHVGVTTGITVYESPNQVPSLFNGIQFIDFISYTAVGAGAIGMGKLIICNGSNMAFRKEAFEDAGGFSSMGHLNTGDDSLLGQMIVKTNKWKAAFNIDPKGTVTTFPVATVKDFFRQRMRWAGQTTEYPNDVLFFMVSSFLLFVILFVWIPMTVVEWSPIPWAALAIKTMVDFYVMNKFCSTARIENTMKYFIPAAVIHIPVILYSVIGGLFGSYRWKDQTIRRTAS